MVTRYTGASLGLLGFSITTAAGLFAQNPVEVILSRSLLSMFVLFGIGSVLGSVAQRVITEYEDDREAGIRERYQENSVGTDDDIPVVSPDDRGREQPLTAGGAVGAS